MASDDTFEVKFATAKEAISQLLDALDIGTVICVDDIYEAPVTLDDLLIAQSQLSEGELRELFGRPNDVFPDDPAVRRQSFREAWQRAAPEDQPQMASRLSRLASQRAPQQPNDLASTSALGDILGDKLVAVKPSDWNATWERLKSDQSERRTLILFDQDLSRSGGAATGGMVLAKAALADANIGDHIMCGLLTHTVTIESQHEEWETLAEDQGVEQDRFIVIAKGWLSRDPFGFARMLKLAALGPDCRAMKERARELLDAATHDAAGDIEKIQVDDFDHMVFRASRNEGLWEPDMLFRLFGIYHRTAVRKRAYLDDRLPKLAARLRSVSHIPIDFEWKPPPETWKVQQAEMYEPGEYLNPLHLPIEIGDIFRNTDAQAEKFYVLVGQPCDLMVRSDGKRHPEGSDVVLVEVVSANEPKEYSIPLPYLTDYKTKTFFAMLRRAHMVHPCVLDLCVMNVDGLSKIDLAGQPPENLLPAWKMRYNFLKEYGDKLLRRYETFGVGKVKDNQAMNFIKTETPKKFPIITSNSGLFNASISLGPPTRSIQFNCKRVMRLHRPRAAALALKYAECFSRPAFERDLGQ